MVEIISKRDGPRREDVQVKQLIEKNRATIVRLADQISGGGYSASKAPKPVPVPKGLIIHTGSRVKPVAEVSPSIRVSLNGRVIAMDENSGRQLEFLARYGDVTEWRSLSSQRNRTAFTRHWMTASPRISRRWMARRSRLITRKGIFPPK